MSERSMADTVAVLIPVFEDRGTLSATLRSLDREDVHVVVVVVDDGSTVPLAGLDSFTRHEVVLIRHDVNRGIEHALNTGLDYIAARGIRFVARLDNGDRLVPQRLTKQLAFLDANPGIGLVGSAVEWRDDAGHSRFTRAFPTKHDDIVRAMHHTTALIHPSVTFRTSVLENVGRYSTEYPAAEDLELFWRIARRHRVANLAETLTVTRFDPGGLSIRRRRRQLVSTLRIQLRFFDVGSLASIYGVVKTLGRFVVPYRWIVALKRYAAERREVAAT
jgi:glycosyltransferase involved in cell wall biosynthesis